MIVGYTSLLFTFTFYIYLVVGGCGKSTTIGHYVRLHCRGRYLIHSLSLTHTQPARPMSRSTLAGTACSVRACTVCAVYWSVRVGRADCRWPSGAPSCDAKQLGRRAHKYSMRLSGGRRRLSRIFAAVCHSPTDRPDRFLSRRRAEECVYVSPSRPFCPHALWTCPVPLPLYTGS